MGTAINHQGNVFKLLLFLFIFPMILIISNPGAASADVDPPQLTNLILSAAAVDVTTGLQQVTVTASLTDASGVSNVWVDFYSPSGGQWLDAFLVLISGTQTDGVFEGTVTFQQGIESGDWTIEVEFGDTLENWGYLDGPGLQGMGLPSMINVVSPPQTDTQAPALGSLSLSAASVDVTTGPQDVTVSIQLTDDTGTDLVWVDFYSPSGAVWMGVEANLVSGTQTSGTYEGTVSIPQDTEGGDWGIYAELRDILGNWVELDSLDLQGMGMPSSLQVVSSWTADLDPPMLTDLILMPPEIDVTTASQDVTVEVHLTDPSGVDYAWVDFYSPFAGEWTSAYLTLVFGTPQDGDFQGTAYFPPGSEGGEWSIEIELQDTANNSGWVRYDDLTFLGFQATLPVFNYSGTFSGSISGNVTEEATGDPIVGIWVCATPFGSWDPGECDDTDTTGHYMISGLAPNDYRVEVGWGTNYAREFFDNAIDEHNAIPVQVVADQDTPNIDFALEVCSSISGRVTEEGTGTALSGFEVSALDALMGNEVAYAETGADGSYTISCLPSGDYKIAALAEDGVHISEFYNGVPGFTSADVITTTAGASVTAIDFSLDVDSDGDGLTDSQETANNTLSNNPDTDGDGVQDLAEVLAGTDPNLGADTPTAAQLAGVGKDLLALFFFNPANRAFEAALTLDPANQEANFFYALTRILDFVQSTEVQNVLNGFGFSGTVNIMQFDNPPIGVTEPVYPVDAAGNIIFPSDLPTGGDILTLLTYTGAAKAAMAAAPESFLNEINGALSNLAAVTDTGFVSTITTESPLPLEKISIEFDYSDVLVMQAFFNFMKSQLLVLASYDFNLDIDDVLNLMEVDDVETVLDNIHSSTQLFTLTNDRLAEAKTALSAAIDFYNLGSAAVRAETDVQNDDFITLDPEDFEEEQLFRDALGDVTAALSGPANIRDMDPMTDKTLLVDLTKLFDDPITDLKSLMPASADVIRDPVSGDITDVALPDETFHGILPLAPTGCTLPGDVDLSSNVDILDAILIVRMAVGADNQPTISDDLCRADLDQNLVVDVQDVILALLQVLGI